MTGGFFVAISQQERTVMVIPEKVRVLHKDYQVTQEPGIEPVIADHLKLSFRDMLDEPCDKIKGRDGFADFMPVIVEGNGVPVIGINAGGGNYEPAEISANVFNNNVRVTVFFSA